MIKPGQVHHIEDRDPLMVFVYGTLIDDRTREYVLKHKSKARAGRLIGYKKQMFDTAEGKDYGDITESPNDSVKGDVFPVTAEDLKKLMDWEDQYNPIQITLVDGTHATAFQLKETSKRDRYKKGDSNGEN